MLNALAEQLRRRQNLPDEAVLDAVGQLISEDVPAEAKADFLVKKENLRDNMTNTERVLNMLAEASVKDISEAVNPKTFQAGKKVARQGGNVAKVARKELEAQTGKKVVTALNAKTALLLKEGKENKKAKK